MFGQVGALPQVAVPLQVWKPGQVCTPSHVGEPGQVACWQVAVLAHVAEPWQVAIPPHVATSAAAHDTALQVACPPHVTWPGHVATFQHDGEWPQVGSGSHVTANAQLATPLHVAVPAQVA